ncbi:hypothetical protein NMY22_g10753 [Coprinellus aureogranulatus]|nr:hypothetical protein NMY22_g10753 [Coprinellus aureogranulatus]
MAGVASLNRFKCTPSEVPLDQQRIPKALQRYPERIQLRAPWAQCDDDRFSVLKPGRPYSSTARPTARTSHSCVWGLPRLQFYLFSQPLKPRRPQRSTLQDAQNFSTASEGLPIPLPSLLTDYAPSIALWSISIGVQTLKAILGPPVRETNSDRHSTPITLHRPLSHPKSFL